MNFVPSADQVAKQLQILIPAIGAVLTAYGVKNADQWTGTAMLVVGPLSIIICSIWSLVDTTRAAIMAKAAKARDSKTPAPQIILPEQESALADKLPNNVTAAPLTK